MSTEKNTNDEDYLSEIMANMKKTVSAKKTIQNGELQTDVPGYLKLLIQFLRILKANNVPVIMKKEKGEDIISCHEFQETNIKATTYQYATEEFREIYNFVPSLLKLSQLKTKISFDGYLIENHQSRNEWWLYKKKGGKVVTEKIVETPKFSDFGRDRKIKKIKDLPVKHYDLPPQASQKNTKKEMIKISEKCFKIFGERWKGEKKIASLSIYFAVDNGDNLLVSDFDVCLIDIKNQQEIKISRKEAINKLQLAHNNLLILNCSNIKDEKERKRKKKKGK